MTQQNLKMGWTDWTDWLLFTKKGMPQKGFGVITRKQNKTLRGPNFWKSFFGN